MEVSGMKKNSAAIDGGDWVGDIPGMGNLRLKVRGSTSRKVRKALADKISGNPNNQTEDSRDRVTAEVFAESVLLDWENITSGGEPVPYSEETALQWLIDPDMDDFFRAVEYASNEVSRRHKEAVTEIAKN